MVEQSFHAILDMGSYSTCQQIANGDADYTVLNVNISHFPVDIFFGICLPKECSQADQEYAGIQITEVLTSAVQSFVKRTGLQSHYIKTWTEVEFFFKKTNEYE